MTNFNDITELVAVVNNKWTATVDKHLFSFAEEMKICEEREPTNEEKVDARLVLLTRILREVIPELKVTIQQDGYGGVSCFSTDVDGSLLPPSLDLVKAAKVAVMSYCIPKLQNLTLMASDCGSHDNKWLTI